MVAHEYVGFRIDFLCVVFLVVVSNKAMYTMRRITTEEDIIILVHTTPPFGTSGTLARLLKRALTTRPRHLPRSNCKLT